jgi:hypothetical protein
MSQLDTMGGDCGVMRGKDKIALHVSVCAMLPLASSHTSHIGNVEASKCRLSSHMIPEATIAPTLRKQPGHANLVNDDVKLGRSNANVKLRQRAPPPLKQKKGSICASLLHERLQYTT